MALHEKEAPFKKTYYLKSDYLLPTIMNKNKLESKLKNFKVREDDVFLLTYPKAGTNWACQIMDAILHIDDLSYLDRVPLKERLPLLEFGPSECPQLAAEGVTDAPSLSDYLETAPSPRKIPTHLVPELLPTQLFEIKPKSVFIERNPKDVIVSLYGWHQSCKFLADTEWDYLLEHYMNGDTVYGSYFEFMKKWLKYKNEPWIVWLRYEDMKKDPVGTISQIAKHMGRNLTQTQLDEVARVSDFKYMKARSKEEAGRDFFLKPEGTWQRKGVAGDWRNYFTVAQNDAFDKVYAEKMKGYEEHIYKFD